MTLRPTRPPPRVGVGSASPKNTEVWGEVVSNDHSVRKEGWKWVLDSSLVLLIFLGAVYFCTESIIFNKHPMVIIVKLSILRIFTIFVGEVHCAKLIKHIPFNSHNPFLYMNVI